MLEEFNHMGQWLIDIHMQSSTISYPPKSCVVVKHQAEEH